MPGSRSLGFRRGLLDSGAGEGEDEASGVETSEADSSGGGVEDGEGDFRCLLEGAGLVSLV